MLARHWWHAIKLNTARVGGGVGVVGGWVGVEWEGGRGLDRRLAAAFLSSSHALV